MSIDTERPSADIRHGSRAPLSALFLAAGLATAIPLGGCAVGPDFEKPPAPAAASFLPQSGDAPKGAADSVPGQRLVRGADIPSRWWEAFHAPALNQLIADGLANNPDLEAAEAAIRMAQANALAARAAFFPVLGGGFESSRQGTAARTLSSNSATGANVYSLHTAQLSISYAPDLFGANRRQVESSQAMVDFSVYQRDGVYLTLASNIATAAIAEGSLRAQIAVVRRLIGIQTQLLGVLKRQQQSGLIGMPDVLAQETALAQTRLLLPPLEKQLGQQRNLLAALTGRLPAQGVRPTFQLSSFRLPRSIPVGLPADLVRRRPDVRAAEANLHALNAQIGVALAQRLPQISLTANAGSAADSLSRIFSPGTGFWLVAGSLAQTIFDAGAREQKQRAAEAATAQAAAQYRSAVLGAFQNVADVLRTLQADAKAVSAATAAEITADRSIALVRKQLDEGQVSIATLINAQQAYLQVALARVQAQAAQLSDTVALFQALGGSWRQPPPPLPPLSEHLTPTPPLAEPATGAAPTY